MAAPVVGSRWKLLIRTHTPAHFAVNIGYFQIQAMTAGPASEQDLADAMYGAFVADLPPLLTQDANYDGCSVQDITTTPHGLLEDSTKPSVPGLVVAAALPSQVCGIITRSTGLAGRSQRGRMYVPFPSTTHNQQAEPPQPTNAYVGLLLALAPRIVGVDVVTGPVVTYTIQHLLFHKETNTFSPTVLAIARQKWATQRRRGAYGAAHR